MDKEELEHLAASQLYHALNEIMGGELTKDQMVRLTVSVLRMLEGAYCEGRRDEQEDVKCRTIQ